MPGLPQWEALKNCAIQFATAETIPNGRLIDYPADWGTPGADRMTGLQLPFKAVPAGSEGALISELKASVNKKSPLLMVFWQPHWALSEYETEWLDLPDAADGCFDDPAWGVNPGATSDCDFPPSRVFKVVWSGFESEVAGCVSDTEERVDSDRGSAGDDGRDRSAGRQAGGVGCRLDGGQRGALAGLGFRGD